MKKNLMLLSSLCLFLGACNNSVNITAPGDHEKKNHTPVEHIENEADRMITSNIRQALLDDNTLSTQSKDVRILTVNGVVTLKGIVKSEGEKNEIGNKAKGTKDVKAVDNQLEIVNTEANQ